MKPETSVDRMRLVQRYPLVTRTVDVGATLWRVTSAQSQDALLNLVETEQDLHLFPYGMLLWHSAIGLAEYLAKHPDIVRGKRVVELGAGAGLPGMIAASLGAKVTQTDYQTDPLILSRLNAAENGISGITQAIGDWRDWQVRGQYDLVIGSDVLYERTLHFELKRLLEHFSQAGARIQLSDPVRPQAMEFVGQLEKQKWSVEMETRTVSWDGEEKEIVIFDLGAPPRHGMSPCRSK